MVTKGEYEKQVREAAEIATSDPEQFLADFDARGTAVLKINNPVGPCKHLITFRHGERSFQII
jgi:hypothetical protein